MAADPERKTQYYEVVAGAAAACQPTITNPAAENAELAHKTSTMALAVVQHRLQQHLESDEVQSMITDAYATVAIAYRRAATLYAQDPEMLRLGTAAVHLVTIATSHVALTRPEN